MKIYNVTVKLEMFKKYDVYADCYDEALSRAELEAQIDAKDVYDELNIETNNIEAINAP
jgi:hypothetical protein